ncbi:MAG: DNA translocase FtsK 4TM domain-containing protein [Brotaphodocola sp.]
MATSSKKTTTQDKASGKGTARSSGKAQGSSSKSSKTGGSSSVKNSGKSVGRPRKQPEPVEEPDSFIRAEVMILLSFALAVLLFLSNFHLCGVAGDLLRGVQLGIFGMVGFIAPLLLFIGTCFYMSNRGNHVATRKLIAAIGLFVVICAFFQLFFGYQPEAGENVLACYRYSAASGIGGGLLGGILCMVLKSALGTIGAFLILLVFMLICVVCITEKSIVKAVKRHSDAAYQYAKEDMDRRREIHAERQEERRRMREEQRVRGVDLTSTYLEPLHDEEDYDEEPEQVTVHQESEPESEKVSRPGPEDAFHGGIEIKFHGSPKDELPFDEEEPEISAQELVAEGIRSFEREEEIFLGKKASEWDALYESGDKEEPEDMTDLEKIPRIVPYQEKSRQLAFEEPEEEIILLEPKSEVTAEPEETFIEDPLYVKSTITGGTFAIPEEEKRVVTSGGKIIETDTEALQKKLESRRKEMAASSDDETNVQQEIHKKEAAPKKEYVFPPVSLLNRGSKTAGNHSEKEYRQTALKLQQTLRDFGVGVTVTDISCGPTVTRYELHPEQGVKVSKIVSLTDDIKLSLAAAEIRIEAPIPGKSAVGIEVPNKENNTVYLRELLEADNFRNHPSRLAFAVGKDIGGQVVVTDIAKMPHLLIAGATGSGKSVCINTLIMSIIFKSSPEDVKMIMIDPKVVELSIYNGIPHLLIPVVTDPKKASGALNWAVAEMTDRYKKFAECNVRDLKGYNAKIDTLKDIPEEKKPKKLPQIVIIVDELADLMMVAPGEVEDAICRLAQLARACGIHLVIATQRPSVNVITGLIKANVPSRIAFSVSSGVDSRTIIDMNGAEKLLGKGDMLFYPAGFPKPQRLQGAFVSDQEVQKIVDFLTEQGMTAEYDPEVEQQMSSAPAAAAAGGSANGRDEYFEQAGKFIIEKEKASIGMLQRVFKIGFNRAARIMDQLAEAGIVGEEEGTKPRKVLMTMEEFEELMGRG